ncbi:MAG: PASTA domain-containing protein [Clostridia bacterium]|nr:PASTA domain-containing protein [Clostridia bacterium]
MDLKRNIAMILCILTILSVSSCGNSDPSSQESEESVSQSQEDIEESENSFRMPDFYGMDYNEAVSQYGNCIQFQENGHEYNELESGLIIEQDIEAGSEFKKGDILKVKISKGMENIEIPNVVNMHAELAKDQLKLIDIECEFEYLQSMEVPKGYVISTEPEVNTEVNKGSTIILYVSLGVDDNE